MRCERGSVTAEAAVALPTLLMLVVFGMGAVDVISAQLRCVDAAREAVRAAVRGEPVGVVHDLASQAAPAGSTVQIGSSGDRVTVVVRADVRLLGGLLPDIAVRGDAVGLREPGAP